MGVPALKKHLLQFFALATTTDELKGNYVQLITAAGRISGKMAPEDDKSLLAVFSEASLKNYYEEYDLEDEPTSGLDGYIVLNDVTICSCSGSTTSMPQMIVFYDQIIGITLGE